MSEIFLNGFQVNFSQEEFTVYVRDMPDNDQFKPLRDELSGEWFLHWRDGICYGLPKGSTTSRSFGKAKNLKVAEPEALKLLASRINSVLPEKFPQYESFRRRPFTFRGRKDEIVAAILSKFKGLPPVMGKFKIYPRFELDARIIEIRESETFIGLFMEVSTNWEIQAPIDELTNAGIDVTNLYVVRKTPQPNERRLVGRIATVSGQRIKLSEYYGEKDEAFVDDVWLEGSKASFAKCLKQILGERYWSFEKERQNEEAKCLTGPAIDLLLSKMGNYLVKASPLELAPDLNCSITSLIKVENRDSYQSLIQSAPVEYCFDAARTKRTRFAWQGIEKYGPFGRDTFAKKSPRVLVVFPDSVQGVVEHFLRCFRDGVHLQSGLSAYSSGFAKTFGLVNPQFTLCRVPWLGAPKDNPATAYRKSLEEFLSSDSNFEAAIVILLDEHSRLPDSDNPYLHSKAVLLMAGIPVQDAKVGTIEKAEDALQWSLQNIAVALYAKLNGVPWTVAHDLTIADELVIGMGMCELLENRFIEKQRFVGITTVFRGDGNYLLGNLSSECSYSEYPAVLQSSTKAILNEIKSRNGWQKNDTVRIVFHSYKPLKNVEVARIIYDCVKEVGAEQNIEFAFLTVSQDHPFVLLDREQQGIAPKYGRGNSKAIFVPQRGLVTQLGRFTRLLCTNGPELIKRDTSPLPRPLLIHIHPQSTFRDLMYLTEQVLKFTSLSCRSTLPAKIPVTIYYSELIAGLLARLRNVRDWSPAMINVKLRPSKWFI